MESGVVNQSPPSAPQELQQLLTSGTYLQRWRIGLAQQVPRKGRPPKRIADEVGYVSEAALAREFKAQTGQSPWQWRNGQ